MTITHVKPAPWRGGKVLANSADLQDRLEIVLWQIANNKQPIGPLANELRKDIHLELEAGSGVVLHKSKWLASIGRSELKSVFELFCSWLGTPVAINKNGDCIKEVMDVGVRDSLNTPQRGHMTNQELAYHSDRADMTALCCWSPASKGGELRLRSSSDVVDGIERRFPHLKTLLRHPIPHDLRGEGIDSYCYLPLLSNEEDSFAFRYIRKFNESVVRHGIELEPEVQELLKAVESEANARDSYAEICFERGFIILINNHTTLHMRTNFEDWGDNQRCLFRCWFGSEFTRALPESFRPIFHEVAAGSLRGGVR